jgi:hypothetical protein
VQWTSDAGFGPSIASRQPSLEIIMSFNLAIASAVSRASLDAAASPETTAAPNSSNASIDDEWCGTRPPGPPLPHPLGGSEASFAQDVDDGGWCGTVPKFHWPFPPPPPPPWTSEISQVIDNNPVADVQVGLQFGNQP